ncbi:MAG: hypothetical protein ABJA81_12865, partial [Nocardioidaceae bacterium]
PAIAKSPEAKRKDLEPDELERLRTKLERDEDRLLVDFLVLAHVSLSSRGSDARDRGHGGVVRVPVLRDPLVCLLIRDVRHRLTSTGPLRSGGAVVCPLVQSRDRFSPARGIFIVPSSGGVSSRSAS